MSKFGLKFVQQQTKTTKTLQLILTQLQKLMNTSKKSTQSTSVSVLQRKKYGCLCKVFCCKCVYCCQSMDFSLLTSEHRKGVFFTMLSQYIKSIQSEPNIIIDPFFIMLGLLLGQQDEQINSATLGQIDDGNEKHSIFCKEDLELYVPQLCTYLVFHEQMDNIPIFNLLERTARLDIQFALLYYSYMRSLETINENTQFKVVMKYNKTFLKKIDQHFKFISENTAGSSEQTIKMYNSRGQARPRQFVFKKLSNCPQRKLYRPCMNTNQQPEEEHGVFGSSLSFLKDLVDLGYFLTKSQERKSVLNEALQEINRRLPADVYLPFRNPSLKSMKVANIVFQQCRVFSTNVRAPYYICLEIYEQKLETYHAKYKRIVSHVDMNESHLRKSHLFQQDTVEQQATQIQKQKTGKRKQKSRKDLIVEKVYNLAKGAKRLYNKSREVKQETQTTCEIQLENDEQETLFLFGESQVEQENRIKSISPFGNLPKYRLAHFMVKTYDDLRQEAFAMQLLEQFNQIFHMEGLAIHVIPYEVIPLGHNCGIIQYLKDALTIDELRKKQGNLQFIQKDPPKLRKFLHTLVGYCLVTYFMQVKDRHNGNIMIRKDGSIIHIDFGFFMSNSPGKGVELEKNVAFKMTTQYIQTLGGLQSNQFSEFRKLFFIGYQACRKHQHRILILAKLMYSSHGTTMPCFQKGNAAIRDLEDRLNPPRMRTDGDLSLFCQNLINKSIDNWRARWYDKWQYYMQGILY